ncbi:MAG: response regulator [Verrucomicrobiota bacterium]|nr:response regulator [Verrucomicrobiota bacterium]
MNAPLSTDEAARLRCLAEYAILDTPPEEAFDELTLLASQICQTPISFISFVDDRRQWNKSRYGLDLAEIPLKDSFIALHLTNPDLFIVEDAMEDPRSSSLSMVQGTEHIRFYAGVPLISSEGQVIGVLSVMGREPRQLTRQQCQALRVLARQVSNQLIVRRDILELQDKQVKTEVALKDSVAFYHSLVENLPQNIFRKDVAGRFTFANSRFCATVGRSLNEILGKTDFDLFPREMAIKYQTDDKNVVLSQKPFDAIEEYRSPEQGTRYVHVIKSPLYDFNGKIVGIQGIFWDETERFNAEAALARERDLLRAMLENIPDHIYFKDRESRFTLVSTALAKNMGCEDAEGVIGKTDWDFFSAEHAQEAYEDEQRIISTGVPMIAKTEHEDWLDGREKWILTTKVPLKNRNGEVVGTFGISKDITALKAVEKELALARDAALESSRLKSEFLANMSHEIRTPMNAIMGMTGLILDTVLTDEQRDFGETIRNSAEALLSIINDILDFSKIEAGKLAVEVIDFDLTEVVEGTVELLAESAQTKGIELASWIHEDVVRDLRGDPGRLRQVLTNLTGNAIKFTPKGEVLVDVTCEGFDEDKAIIKIAVRDSGIGITQEAQSRIFQAFTQADGSMTRRYGGTGLGLAISKQLVELMGGKIGFESTPGKGSTFWMVIPFERNHHPKPRPHAVNRESLEGVRVMVVDDNETNRQIVHHQILAWKMRNGSAASGPDALQLLHKAVDEGDPYQLVILDMQMPDMDGMTLARQIKADPKISSVKLVMLTSLGYFPEERSWKEAGISAYLVKPVKQSRLFDALALAYDSDQKGQSRMRASAPVPASKPEQTKPTPKHTRILVAEDNMVNQKVALRQLQRLGYQADAVANGLEVLTALERIPYDIILMDCQMPELDGYATARKIRQLEAASQNRDDKTGQYIIAMTANALAGDREVCIAAGMNDYISKPVRIEELEAALQRGIDQIAANPMKSSSNPEQTEPTIDKSVLENLRALKVPGEPDPLAELIELFLGDTPARLEKIEIAVRAEDPHTLENAAHSLKGSASNLGAARLGTLCAEMVNHAREKNLGAAADMLPLIKDEFYRVTEILAQEKEQV